MKYLAAAALALYTLLIYLGLPLLGWGLDALPAFFANPARLVFAAQVAVTAVLAGYQAVAIPQVGGFASTGDANKRVRRQTIARVVLVLALFASFALLAWADRRNVAVMTDLLQIRFLGQALYAAGGLLAFWAALALGRQYTPEVTIQPDHQLITGGPFRVIRHPRYLGVTILGLGIALTFRSWLGVALTVLIFIVLAWRIGDEEAMLRREFGAAWDAYCRQTWRLVPFVY